MIILRAGQTEKKALFDLLTLLATAGNVRTKTLAFTDNEFAEIAG